ncbi:MAG: AAA family ATPase [Kofleriaceae bacterium]
MRADRSGWPALRTLPAEIAEISRALTSFVTSGRGSALVDDLRATTGGTASEVVWLALLADCLRVIYSAVLADGEIEDREIDAVEDIIATAAEHYAARPGSQYAALVRADREASRTFLDCYAADRSPFGRGARIRWPGLMMCRKAAELGERAALQRYTKAMTSLIAEAARLGGVPDGDPRGPAQADELHELERLLASEATMANGVDRRVQAFLAPCRVFSAVQQASSIFENDPFDVEAVHREARVSFEQLVAQATMRPYVPDLGRMLVVLGDSGSGKTHLLRGFRRHVQEGNRGFVVYAQLQSRTEDYSRYLLFHLVDSLSRRYSEQSGRTGLLELASGLLRIARPALRSRLERLVNDTWEGAGNLTDYVNEVVDDLIAIRELRSFDLDLLRVLVYALRPDPRTTSSVYKYLHCDHMNDHDRRWIGGLEPRTRDEDPQRMIRAIASFAAVTDRALVVMVDQVDLAGFDADSTKIFRRAIDALYRIVSENASAVAVVACLSDLYNTARAELSRPAIDRLESSPPLARLQINRSYVEIEAVVARRLAWQFAEHGTVHRPEQPVYPIPKDELKQLENRRLRDVLEWCHQFQSQCAAAGQIINADEAVIVETRPRELDLDTIAAAWSDAIQATALELPNEEDEILAVVADAAQAYVLETGLALTASSSKNGLLRLQMSRDAEYAALAIAVVNRGYHRGHFPDDIDSLRRRARGMVPVAVRTLEFPRGRACDRAMGQLINMRGRQAYLDTSTLRTLVAFQRFQPPFAPDRITAWKLRDRPISSLPAVLEIFDFDRSRVERPVPGPGGRSRRATPVPVEAEASDATLDDAAPEPADVRDSAKITAPAAAAMPLDPPIPQPVAAVAPTRGVATSVPRPPAASTPTRAGTAPVQPRGVERGGEPVEPAAPVGAVLPAEDVRRPRARAPSVAAPSVATSRAGTAPPSEPLSRSALPLPAVPPSPGASLRVGNSTSFEAEPILLEPAALLRHVAVVDCVGNGRLMAALNLIEQTLERGVPAIVLDRTGEMTGYARPDWWLRSASPTRARQLAERIDVRLFTPGIRGGRPLSVAMVPDLSRVPHADHDRDLEIAAAAVAAILRPSETGDNAGRLALLTRAIAVLARRSTPGEQVGLPELIELIETGVDELATAAGDPSRPGLIEDLAALLGNVDVFIPGAEALTAATLVGPAPGGRVPLAIIQTGFLGDGPRLRAWVAQLVGAVSRELASSASKTLKAVLVLDGADLFLPASSRTAPAKEPLQELLARAGAAGLGMVLASQRPAELDYRRCASIQTWFVGKTDEATLGRMTALFEQRPLGHRNPGRLEPTRFVMLHDGGARDVERAAPLIRIETLGETELKSLAARAHPRTRVASVRRTEPANEGLPPPHVPSR